MLKYRVFFVFLLLIVTGIAGQVLAEVQDQKEKVVAFYEGFESSMNAKDFKTAYSLIDTHVAKDFGHYDDGALIYGKPEFLAMISDREKLNTHTDVRIDMGEVQQAADDPQELRVDFKIFESRVNPVKTEQSGLACADSIRLLPDGRFELYKCDCKKIEYAAP